jgi:hypothetical protein
MKENMKRDKDHAFMIGRFANPEMAAKLDKIENDSQKFESSDASLDTISEMIDKEVKQEETKKKKRKFKK